jgi:hypothetical protein
MRYLSLTLIFLANQLLGQTVKSVRFDELARERKVIVELDKEPTEATASLKPEDFEITFLPSKTKVSTASIAAGSLTSQQAGSSTLTELRFPFLQIGLKWDDPSSKPPADDTQVEVAVNLTFADKNARLQGIGPIYNKGNIKDLVSLAQKNLSTAISGIKTKQEKDQFLGLSIVIPQNNSSAASGSTDLVFNQTFYSASVGDGVRRLFDSATVGIDLQKGTTAGSDPRHFAAGIQARKTFLLLGKSDLDRISTVINTPTPTASEFVEADAALDKIRGRFFRSLIWDNGTHFEGDAQAYKITNFSNAVYDTDAQFVAASQPFAGRQGFWNLRAMPAGFELGHNLTAQQTDNAQRGAIARYKLGADLQAYYTSKNNTDQRLEFEAFTVDRYLIHAENGVDATTKKVVALDPGWRNWVEADLKFFFGIKLFNVRPGLKISYQRGSLPPVYASTKAFNLGFIFESSDDKSGSK